MTSIAEESRAQAARVAGDAIAATLASFEKHVEDGPQKNTKGEADHIAHHAKGKALISYLMLLLKFAKEISAKAGSAIDEENLAAAIAAAEQELVEHDE